MSFKVILQPAAEADLQEAYEWYEQRETIKLSSRAAQTARDLAVGMWVGLRRCNVEGMIDPRFAQAGG